MFRKVNLKTMFILLAILLVLVIGTKLMDKKKGNRSFKSDLIEIEANEINKILVFPKTLHGGKLELGKENGRWFVSSEGKKFNADNRTAESVINELDGLKPESVASTKKERWPYYQVDDSAGTRVQLFQGNTLKADVYLGKFSYSGQQKATSYVRLAGEKETYGVNGFVASSFNRDLNGFKDKTIIHSSKDDWTKLTFGYPADSSFVMERQNGKWAMSGSEADSSKVATFLSSIQNLNHYKFAGDEATGQPTFKLNIEGGETPIEIKGYEGNTAEQFMVSSSQNPGAFFQGKDLKEKLFPPGSKFIQSK